jgi:hypothetical protein
MHAAPILGAALALLLAGCFNAAPAQREPYEWIDRFLLEDQVPNMRIDVYSHEGWFPARATLDAVQTEIQRATGRETILLGLRGSPGTTAGPDNTWDQNEVQALVDEIAPRQEIGTAVAAIAFVAGKTNGGQVNLGGVAGIGGGRIAIVFSEQMANAVAIDFLGLEIPNQNFEAFERAAAVHELGHVLGLVDQAVPRRHGPTSSDGAHSDDEASVMYPAIHSQDVLGLDPEQVVYRFTADDIADIRDFQAEHGFHP